MLFLGSRAKAWKAIIATMCIKKRTILSPHLQAVMAAPFIPFPNPKSQPFGRQSTLGNLQARKKINSNCCHQRGPEGQIERSQKADSFCAAPMSEKTAIFLGIMAPCQEV